MRVRYALAGLISFLLLRGVTLAQERIHPVYLVTYDHYMEELAALERLTVANVEADTGINTFSSNWTEIEYGARRWWSTAVYFNSQHTQHEGSLFTGFKFENRCRAVLEEHWINPVLYIEYEH